MLCRPVYCAGTSPAIKYARRRLDALGVPLLDGPHWNTGHLLLDVPTFRAGSGLCENGNLDTLLSALPHDVTVWGGNLAHPALEGIHTVDLLQDESYLAENASITAHCTLRLVSPMLTATWKDTPTLVIGWGRIGKCLAKLLRSMDCPVTVAVRSIRQLAALQSLGYQAIDSQNIDAHASNFRLVINTVPHPILEGSSCQGLKIDLASKKGITGEDVVWARGLPGIHAPESSGRLIADTFLRLVKDVEK